MNLEIGGTYYIEHEWEIEKVTLIRCIGKSVVEVRIVDTPGAGLIDTYRTSLYTSPKALVQSLADRAGLKVVEEESSPNLHSYFKTYMEFYLDIPDGLRGKGSGNMTYRMKMDNEEVTYSEATLKARAFDEIFPYLLTEDEANALLHDLVRRQEVMGILDGPAVADQNVYEKLINLLKAGAGKPTECKF